eukprot:1033473-Rhodomonas_salina.1
MARPSPSAVRADDSSNRPARAHDLETVIFGVCHDDFAGTVYRKPAGFEELARITPFAADAVQEPSVLVEHLHLKEPRQRWASWCTLEKLKPCGCICLQPGCFHLHRRQPRTARKTRRARVLLRRTS